MVFLNVARAQQGALKAEVINQKSQAETCCLCKLTVVNTVEEEHKAEKSFIAAIFKTTLKLVL